MCLRLALEFLQIGCAAALLVELVLPSFVSALTRLHNGGLGSGKSLDVHCSCKPSTVITVAVLIMLL